MTVRLLICALLLLVGRADADEPVRLRLFGQGPAYAPQEADEPEADLPRVRLEGTLQATALVSSKVKHGPERQVHGFEPHKDGHLPIRLEAGWFAQVDVVMWSWASLGAVAWSTHAAGPKRRIHYEGIQLNGRSFAGGDRLKTTIAIRYAEVSLRYLWRRDADVQLWFGIGPAWISYRIALRGDRVRATSRMETVLGPSFTYALAARVKDWLSLFLESGFAVAPSHRFPSVVAGTRLGVRLHLGAGVELVLALNNRVGVLSESTQLGNVARGHNWRKARFFVLGLELGLGFSL